MEEMIKLLQEQNQLLREMLVAQHKPVLGFSDRPPGQPSWVFVGRNGESCLYTLDSASQQIPMKERAITGYVTGLSVDKVMRRNKEIDKLNVTVRTDTSTYILSGGVDTCYAKSLLSTVAIMEAANFVRPVTLAFAPGDDDNVIWCRVYAPDYIKAPTWDEHTNWDAIAQAALTKFTATPAPVATPTPQPVIQPVQQKQARTDNVVNLPSQQRPVLFPQHNNFIKRVRGISGHNTDWIVAQCRAYGGEQPGHLEPDSLRKLVMDMAADYGFTRGAYSDRQKAATAYQGKIAFFEGAGRRWGEGVLAWFNEVKTSVS